MSTTKSIKQNVVNADEIRMGNNRLKVVLVLEQKAHQVSQKIKKYKKRKLIYWSSLSLKVSKKFEMLSWRWKGNHLFIDQRVLCRRGNVFHI